ncbi:MAG: hypothetical protein KME27_20790 [Lyngbya sp. HA4199-MV5]|nr:hypothetical protein [Lyngbya sp. HA4199-MV5]
MDKAEAAALALSESRLPEAFSILKPWWKRIREQELRKTGLLAIATLRQPDALEFLLALIADGKPQAAIGAIKAIGVYVQDQALWQRVCRTSKERQDVDLKPFLEKVSKSMPV